MGEIVETLENAKQAHIEGRVEHARDMIAGILDSEPDTPEDFARIAQHCLMLADTNGAERAFRQATTRFPTNAAVHHNLGSFFAVNRRYAEAENAYRCALAIDPKDAETFRNLANVLMNAGRLSESEETFRAANRLAPGDIGAINSHATVLYKLSRFHDVLDILDPAILAQSEDILARITYGAALNKVGRYAEHREMLRRFVEAGEPVTDPTVKIVLDMFINGDIAVAEESALLRELFDYLNDDFLVRPPEIRPAAGRRLKIGYLTRYFDKPNYMGFLNVLLEHHDAQRFELIIYSDTTGDIPDKRVVGTGEIGNVELNRRMRADGIDVLVDLNGMSSINRMSLMALKPAPVIISWFNTFSTLGLKTVDYILGDDIVTPESEDKYFAEKIWRLPGCYMLRETATYRPPVTKPPMLKNGYCTFGTLGSDHKINAVSIEVWAEIMNRVPESRFILRNSRMDGPLSAYYRAEFSRHGISEDRIETLGPVEHYRFVETYNSIDIVLDTFPWNGGVTTLEALWQGAPVVAFNGDKWVSRAGASFVSAIGRQEWVGADVGEYIEIAVDLARDPARLAKYRQQQRNRMSASVIHDGARFTANLEAAFEQMFREKEEA